MLVEAFHHLPVDADILQTKVLNAIGVEPGCIPGASAPSGADNIAVNLVQGAGRVGSKTVLVSCAKRPTRRQTNTADATNARK